MNAILEQLAASDGVAGLCAHRGGIIKWQRLPDSLSSDRAAALCHAVSQAFASYAKAERPLQQAYFEFPGQGVLVVARTSEDPATTPGFFLTFLLNDRSAAPAAIIGAAAYFKSESRA